jgi:hypothetical protein
MMDQFLAYKSYRYKHVIGVSLSRVREKSRYPLPHSVPRVRFARQRADARRLVDDEHTPRRSHMKSLRIVLRILAL